MMIKNFRNLASNPGNKIALQVLDAGLAEAMPGHVMKKIVQKNRLVIGKNKVFLSKYERIFVIAFGKASDSMTSEVSLLTRVDGGIVVVPQGVQSVLKNKKFEIIYGGHPLPNKHSVYAAKKIIKFLKERKENDFVIFLISGGGSSLVSLPDGISLGKKKSVTGILIKSGANIHEINCVRKRFSKIKGGKMLEYLNCNAVSLIMSDVIDNDVSSIASGPTYSDKTTFYDALSILKKYGMGKLVPSSVLKTIDSGTRKIAKAPIPKIKNYVIATNKRCLGMMAKKARNFGFDTKIVYPVSGNVKDAAKKLSKTIPKKSRSCTIFGGEPTVRVHGRGKGGRNQELVLYLLKKMQETGHNMTIASVGTDGIDGNTDAAGAIVNTLEFDFADAKKFLQNNNSYIFHKKHNSLIFSGFTHTNLMDIGIILRQ